jgi:LacI family transcriptional regulator
LNASPLSFPLAFTVHYSGIFATPIGALGAAWVPPLHRVTIKEIAALTGVSMQTVSRVLNKRPDVSPATRLLVEAAIEEHGFRPSAVARSLVNRRSRMLGVIASGLHYLGVGQTVTGIADEAEASGYSIILKELAGFDAPDIVPVVELLLEHRVEGIIFAGPQMVSNVRHVQDQLPAARPPIVFLKSEPSPEFTTIGIDNVSASRLATEHLLALGRRRIAHLAGPLGWREARDRRAGWLAALADEGLTPGPLAIGDWLASGGVSAFEAILDEAPDIDGLVAASDLMALGAIQVAHRRGIRIPDDVAIVGFDGLEESAHFTPSLTTVLQPLTEMGRAAVRELVTSVEGDTGVAAAPVRTLVLPTTLIYGESAPALATSGASPG